MCRDKNDVRGPYAHGGFRCTTSLLRDARRNAAKATSDLESRPGAEHIERRLDKWTQEVAHLEAQLTAERAAERDALLNDPAFLPEEDPKLGRGFRVAMPDGPPARYFERDADDLERWAKADMAYAKAAEQRGQDDLAATRRERATAFREARAKLRALPPREFQPGSVPAYLGRGITTLLPNGAYTTYYRRDLSALSQFAKAADGKARRAEAAGDHETAELQRAAASRFRIARAELKRGA